MSFISVSFLVFYLIVLMLRFTIGRDSRNGAYLTALLLLSLVFYSWHVPRYLLLILVSALTDYVAARWIGGLDVNAAIKRRAVLVGSLIINLGLLGYFKYTGFLINSLADAGVITPSHQLRAAVADIVLPIGISFYTFQSMSYTIDVYRGEGDAEHRFSRVMLYVSFFPQLVAGPIVRAHQFLYQLSRRRKPRTSVFLEGAWLIIRGLFLKIVVADNIGAVVDKHWKEAASLQHGGALTVYLAVLFSCQIYCDFMGYTDIARGVAYQLGFRLPVNFNAPYIAATFSEFWHRWHITLSQWMRDYVYISLGGNRKGRAITCFNLFVVMLVSGLWHGAAMNFLVWGGIHGTAIVIERLLRITNKSPRWLLLPWFLVVQLTWIVGMAVFRSGSGSESLIVLHNLWHGLQELRVQGPMMFEHVTMALWFTLPVWVIHLRRFAFEHFAMPEPGAIERCVYVGAMVLCLLTLYPTTLGFIYYQF